MALVNMCLAVNGGVLENEANEAMRDGNFVTSAIYKYAYISPAVITTTSSITFPACRVNYIMFSGNGSASAWDGSMYMEVYVRIGASWSSAVYHIDGTGVNDSYDSGTVTISTGWDNCTGIRMYSWNNNVSTVATSHNQCEIQAWGNKGGYSCVI